MAIRLFVVHALENFSFKQLLLPARRTQYYLLLRNAIYQLNYNSAGDNEKQQ